MTNTITSPAYFNDDQLWYISLIYKHVEGGDVPFMHVVQDILDDTLCISDEHVCYIDRYNAIGYNISTGERLTLMQVIDITGFVS